MNRDATSSYKGYLFQRVMLMYIIFSEYVPNKNIDLNNIFFQEEHMEDICIYKVNDENDEKFYLYQIKYLNTDINESIAKKSGFTKVIISHYNNPNIDKIYYKVVSTTGNIGKTGKLLFYEQLLSDNNNNYLIGKFIILSYCSKKFNNLKGNSYNYLNNIAIIKQFSDVKLTNLIQTFKNAHNINENDIDDELETDDTLKKDDKRNLYSIFKFCEYCNDPNNTSLLIEYLKKIEFDIIATNYSEIHSETIELLNNTLEEFKKIHDDLSENHRKILSLIIYGLFDSVINEILFSSQQTKQSLTCIIDAIKNKLNSLFEDNDMLIYIINIIKSKIESNEFEDLKTYLFSDESFVLFLFHERINMTDFIKKIKVRTNENHMVEKIGDIIKECISQMCQKMKYNVIIDKNLISFMQRLNNNKIKFTGTHYTTLKTFDEAIVECVSQNET